MAEFAHDARRRMYNLVRNWNMSRGSRMRNYVASSRCVSPQSYVIRVTYTRHRTAQNKVGCECGFERCIMSDPETKSGRSRLRHSSSCVPGSYGFLRVENFLDDIRCFA